MATIAQSVPFDMRIPLSAIGGALSVEEALIPRGAVRGAAISVIPQGNGPATVLAAAPGLPPRCEDWEFWAAHSDPCFYGLEAAAGAPLVLYGLPDQTLAPDGVVRFDLPTAFPDFGAGTAYAVESSNPKAVEVSMRGGLLILSVADGGETEVTVTATDPDGLSAVQVFTVTVNPFIRSLWGGWRSALLRPPPAEDDGG